MKYQFTSHSEVVSYIELMDLVRTALTQGLQ